MLLGRSRCRFAGGGEELLFAGEAVPFTFTGEGGVLELLCRAESRDSHRDDGGGVLFDGLRRRLAVVVGVTSVGRVEEERIAADRGDDGGGVGRVEEERVVADRGDDGGGGGGGGSDPNSVRGGAMAKRRGFAWVRAQGGGGRFVVRPCWPLGCGIGMQTFLQQVTLYLQQVTL